MLAEVFSSDAARLNAKGMNKNLGTSIVFYLDKDFN
jgi:hypothetical protein